jgi:hypothetical protein
MHPGRALGLLYGRGPSTVVLWADDYTVEDSPMGSSTPEDLKAFEQLLDDIRLQVQPPNMAVAHDTILSAGWEERGTLKYEIQSGLLLVNAAALAETADELWREREGILAKAGSRHPEFGSEVWAQWVTVTSRRSATVRGSRALALATVEALVTPT